MVEILTYSVGRQNGRDGPHLDTDDDKKIHLVKQKPQPPVKRKTAYE